MPATTTAPGAARLGVRPRRGRRAVRRAPPAWPCSPGSSGRSFGTLITSDSSRAALSLSLRTSVASTVLCIVFGVPMALVLARTEFRGQSIARSLVLLPLVLPPVVGGIALLYTFGRRGLLGHTIEVLGLQIAFSTTAVVMAQTFVALPFLVVSLEGALRTGGQRFEEVAATLGARPTTVFLRVTLPLVLPGPRVGCGARLRPGAG